MGRTIFASVIAVLFLSLGVYAQKTSQDYLKARPEIVEAWKDMRFGMFLFEPRQVESFKQIGKWMEAYGESIYETRGGPFIAPDAGVRTFGSARHKFDVPEQNRNELGAIIKMEFDKPVADVEPVTTSGGNFSLTLDPVEARHISLNIGRAGNGPTICGFHVSSSVVLSNSSSRSESAGAEQRPGRPEGQMATARLA